MSTSKVTVIISNIIAVIQGVIGFSLAFFGLLGTLFILPRSTDSMDIFMVIFFVGVGSLLIAASMKRIMRRNRFNQYVSLLSRNMNGSIPSLALSTRLPEEKVIKDLQKMINKNFFTDAYIDLNSKRIIFKNQEAQIPAARPEVVSESAPIMITVRCNGCGGVNQIEKGKGGKCEYCGLPL